MNGPQLAERLSAARTGLRVLFASGYAADALGPRGVLGPGIAIIEKPFKPADLATRVRAMLDRPGDGPAIVPG
jgi:DNA-binding response OmpR family regulator